MAKKVPTLKSAKGKQYAVHGGPWAGTTFYLGQGLPVVEGTVRFAGQMVGLPDVIPCDSDTHHYRKDVREDGKVEYRWQQQ
jgi:hypothetical protein